VGAHLAQPVLMAVQALDKGVRVGVRDVEVLAGLLRDLGQRIVVREVNAREQVVLNLRTPYVCAQ